MLWVKYVLCRGPISRTRQPRAELCLPLNRTREVELSRERHESDLKEKRRVARMLSSDSFPFENMEIFQNRVIRLREAEFERQKREKEKHIGQVIQARKQERDVKRKQIHYLKCEEEKIRKVQEEEEAQKQRGSAGDQWGSRRPQHSGRDNSAPLVEGDHCGNGSEQPGGDSWRSEEATYAFRGSSSPMSFFSSRTSPEPATPPIIS
ncbi:hypothetical protein Bca101_063242 [Brassica carinata]